MPARTTSDAHGPELNGFREMQEVALCGVSGAFPRSDNMEEFKNNLFEHVDMVETDVKRWPDGLYGLPVRVGRINDISKFDSSYFGVHAKQADAMDAMMKLLLEKSYEAILDAGMNPEELRGTKTGVYIGVSTTEFGDLLNRNVDKISGYNMTGATLSMMANRISFTFDFKGPSFIVDTACSSSLIAFHLATQAIKSGEINAAIVGGANILLKPVNSVQFQRLNMLSAEGKCKAFDSTGSGYVRSEAVACVFLQRAQDSRRVYAYVLNTGTNIDGNKQEGITFPSGKMQKTLVEKVFKEGGLDPLDITYVEAHGTGTKVGDPQEINSIADFFCKGRKSPLLIGSVKSNMGHSEPASGVCSLAKIVIAMESGKIPANLHFKDPNPDIPGLLDGRLKVVNENLDWNPGLVAVNSFGFGGANAHAVLKPNTKPKTPPAKDNVPRLVCLSGRTEEAVDSFLEYMETTPRDDDLITLLHTTYKKHIPGHPFRGYTVLGTKDGKNMREVFEEPGRREIWFVFSGMGAQWPGMGLAFMCFEPFAVAIHRCASILKQQGFDLLDLLTNSTEETFSNVVNSFVGIAAVQIALVDLLTALGIKPDKIIGHSAGEVACGYADGCTTLEETILSAYWRGKSVLDAGLIEGGMAAVGLTWEETKKRCPPRVNAVCHNSETSVTISGPNDDVEQFVKVLKADNIFAKKVASSKIAFHSPYIKDAAPILRKNLESTITSPKKRSDKWLSSSIPQAGWGSQIAQHASPAYFVNNLLSPVLFHEVATMIPENATVIEIAPHCLLNSVLKKTIPKSCINIGLVKRGVEDDLAWFMSNVGKMFVSGLNPDLSLFHKPSSFPVARSTPMISPRIKWDHSQTWLVPDYKAGDSKGGMEVVVSLEDEKDAYISGHNIDGRVLFPATGYLTLVWRAFAKLKNKDVESTPVRFENVNILRATIMPKDASVKFFININDVSGSFELTEGDALVVNGKIVESSGLEVDGLKLSAPVVKCDKKQLEKGEVYRDLRLRGYGYQGLFQGIKHCDNVGANGVLEWKDNWISFMDTMLQFSLVGMNTRELYVPTRILRVTIDPALHLNLVKDTNEVPVEMHKHSKVVRSGGVEIRGMMASQAPRRIGVQAPPKTEQYSFVPFNQLKEVELEDAVTSALQLVLENSGGARKLNVVEVYQETVQADSLLAPMVVSVLESEPQCSVDLGFSCPNSDTFKDLLNNLNGKVLKKELGKEAVGNNLHLVVTSNVLKDGQLLKNALASLNNGGFILTFEHPKVDLISNGNSVEVVSKTLTPRGSFVLVRKVEGWKYPKVIEIDSNFNWVETVKTAMKDSEKTGEKYLVASLKEPESGILGFFNCLKQEPGGENFRCVFVADSSKLDLSSQREQLKKDLLVNVYKGGEWGSMRHLLVDVKDITLDVKHAYINTITKGDLASLRWIESPLGFNRPEHNKDLELCTVYYSTLNFKDVMLASGKLPMDALPGRQAEEECILGFEYSGRDSKGNRIMGLVRSKAMATSVLADVNMKWPIPARWTMEDAATVPAVYATSYYSLIVRGKLKRGEKVLVHAGTGGVGQAAIRIALSLGCEVFTTVSTKEKKEFLLKVFPNLKEENIGNSRDTTFEQLVLERTGGEGVDVALNSLAGDLLQATIRCLGENGRFLEIGKADMFSNTPIGMSVLKKGIEVHGILLDAVFEIEGSTDEKKQIVELLSNGIETGVVQPLVKTTFHHTQVEQAFRYMASGKHIGKVLLEIKKEECEKVVKNVKPQVVTALPKTYMNPDKSYVILGGLGGFGLELANWLLVRGAKHVILVSRRGVTTGYQAMCLRRWEERGYNVTISTEDATTLKGAKKLLQDANKLAPVGGIFNLAAVLRDSFMEKLTKDDFVAVCKVKVDTTKYLDLASRELCPELDYFVVYSSVSCGRGNAGQTNYGYANSAMERICEARQALSLPGTAVQWGAVGDVGLVIDGLKGDNETVVGGTLPQRITSCLATLDSLLQTAHPVVASMVVAERRRKGKEASTANVLDMISNILGIKNVQKIADATTLSDIGMDSLMGAEIKQVLERGFDIILSPVEIRNLTFGKLREIAEGRESSSAPAVNSSDEKLISFESEQLLPEEVMVKLKSGDNSKNGPWFFVHPIEGTSDIFKTVAQAMSVPEEIWGLQCTADVPMDTTQQMAEYYTKEIKKVQPNGPYRLVGYSFGAMVAFEMALLLETYKEKVTLVFLDGSPTFVTAYTGRYKENRNKDANDADALAYFVALFNPATDIEQTQNDLRKLPNIEARLKMVTTRLQGHTKFSDEQISQAAFVFFKKLLIASMYKPNNVFKGKATLIKANEGFVGNDIVTSVTNVCKEKPDVHTMEGDHKTILQGESGNKIATILSNLN
ncbi:fatty acid synthase-like isoform X2 [Cimex lectularius]|nr:fatty acid synthase-like isoform X2 [Cimex lectularius]XP_024080781.1 fatty acid synthase-like isoform X2 [Cimex lectularius]